MISFFERIMQVADFKGYKNPNDFAKNGLNWSSSEKINRLKDEKKNPSIDMIVEISNKFEDINIKWLLTGKGNMLENGGVDEAEVTFLKEKNILLQKNSKLLEEKVERLEEELTALKKRILFTEETKSKVA